MVKLKSPSYIDTGLEGIRTGAEMLNSVYGFARDFVMSKSDVYRGPVMLTPGFMAHDMTTYSLRTSLRPEGYVPYDSNTGINLGVSENILARQQEQLDRIFEAHDGQPVALIGHSLGGVQSTLLAYRNPEKVSSVITLGSPLGSVENGSGVNLFVEGAFMLLNDDNKRIQGELAEYMKNGPPNAFVTSVYSKYDGVVSTEAAQNPWAGVYDGFENIEVHPGKRQSHVGMICSTEVLDIIKDQLDQCSPAIYVTEPEFTLT